MDRIRHSGEQQTFEDNGYFINLLFGKYALPSILTLVGAMSSTTINGIMAGKYFGGSGLAVIGVCSTVFFLFSALGALIGTGAASRAAKFVAEDNFDEVSRLYSASVILMAVTGLIVSALCIIFSRQITGMLTGNAELLPMVYKYYMLYVPFGIFTMLQYIPVHFARLDGKPNVGAYMYVVMVLLNILCNYVFIEYFELGVPAVAAGTSAATAGACITGACFLSNGKGNLRLVLPQGIFKQIPGILTAGSPTAVKNFSTLLRTFALNKLLLSIDGGVSIAVFAVITSINSLATAVMLGVGQAVVPLVGVFTEERDTTSVRQVVRRAFVYGGVIISVFAICLLLFQSQICGIFSITDNTLRGALKNSLWFFAPSLPLALVNTVFMFYYMAASKIRLANVLTVSRNFLIAVPLAWVLSASFGAQGVWLSFMLTEALALAFMFIHTAIITRENTYLSAPLLIDRRLEKEGRYLSFSVDNNEEAIVEASEKVVGFCERIDMSAKQAMLLSMSIEEIIMIIVRHGINGRSYNAVSVRITVLDGITILRFRSGGRRFNPIDYYNKIVAEDFESSLNMLGVKYIVEAAGTVYYRETLGINNLVLII